MSDQPCRPITQHEFVLEAFTRLYKAGLSLGIDELLAALHVLDVGAAGESMEELLSTLTLIWCKSTADEALLKRIREQIETARMPLRQPDAQSGHEHPPVPPHEQSSAERLSPPNTEKTLETERALQARVFQLPSEAHTMEAPELQSYFPLSRRYMIYSWRYLRYMIPDGPTDIVDLPATIRQTVNTGLFQGAVFCRRVVNHARLTLFLDQQGSMTPFHRYLRDLVETAKYESGLDPDAVDVYYFSNVPTETVSRNPHLTERVTVQSVLETIDPDTAVLIVSDAGAARGSPYRRGRVQTTLRFLRQIRAQTSQVVWLNPVPKERWTDTSAEYIASAVTMVQMDEHGFTRAIDELRGLNPSVSEGT